MRVIQGAITNERAPQKLYIQLFGWRGNLGEKDVENQSFLSCYKNRGEHWDQDRPQTIRRISSEKTNVSGQIGKYKKNNKVYTTNRAE